MANFDPLDAQDIETKIPRMGWLVLRLFGRRMNGWLFSPVLNRAHERGVITSEQLHTIAAQFDPTQRGVMGRINGR